MILCYFPVIEVGDTQIHEYAEDKRKIEKCKIDTVILRTNDILHRSVYPQNPEWFNEQVKENQ